MKDSIIKKYSKVSEPSADSMNLPYPGNVGSSMIQTQMPKSSGFRTNRNSNITDNRMFNQPQYRSGQPDPSLQTQRNTHIGTLGGRGQKNLNSSGDPSKGGSLFNDIYDSGQGSSKFKTHKSNNNSMLNPQQALFNQDRTSQRQQFSGSGGLSISNPLSAGQNLP